MNTAKADARSTEPIWQTWHEDYMNTSIEICKYHHEKWDGKVALWDSVGTNSDFALVVSWQTVSVTLTSREYIKMR